MNKSIFLLLFFSFQIRAQTNYNLSFKHINRDQGLSNSNILSLLKDHKGFLWLGSMNGLNRFDGKQIKVYKPYNTNIRGNYINALVADNQNRIWVGTNEGLSFYDEKSNNFIFFKGPQNQDKYEAVPYYADSNQKLWVLINANASTDLYVFDIKTMTFNLILKNSPKSFSKVNNSNFSPLKNLYYTSGQGFTKIDIKNYAIVKTESYFNNNPKFININKNMFLENDSTLWFTNSTLGLSEVNLKTKKHKSYFKYENQELFWLNNIQKHKNQLIVCGNGGLLFFDLEKKKFSNRIKHDSSKPNGISANYIEEIYIDKNENLFCSVYGNGIDYTNLKEQNIENIFDLEKSKTLGYTDNTIFRMLKKNNNILLKLQQGGAVEINDSGKVINEIKKGGQPIFVDDKGRYWSTNNAEKSKILIYDSELKLIKTISPKPLFNWFSFYGKGLNLSPTEYLISNKETVFEYNEIKDKWTPITKLITTGSPINTFIFDPVEKLLFVSSNWWNKFSIYDKKSGNWTLLKGINFGFNVFCIYKSTQKGYLWLGTSKGLVHFNYKTLKYRLLTEKNGLNDDAVKDIIVEPSGNLWIVTDLGLSYYNKENGSFTDIKSVYGENQKSYNGNQNFKINDSILILAGTQGVSKIKSVFNKIQHKKLNIEITDFTSNDKAVSFFEKKQINLKADENSFNVNATVLEAAYSSNFKIKYRLVGHDLDWVNSENPIKARYTKVKEGDYTLEISALDPISNKVIALKSVSINIATPFFKSLLFKIGLALSLISAAYIFYRLRSEQIKTEIRKIEEIKRIKAESEINALRSQMNPHFIFNSLNTVDSYIQLNQADKASDFLGKFSKLIRMVLENARQDFVPINQDLRALDLYLKLEQERSLYAFEYKINFDPKNLNDSWHMPSTILQPFVENAILHGLRHKSKGKNMLDIYLKREDNMLIINIIDNGIGRRASGIINNRTESNRNSLGLKITEDRILNLNKIYPDRANFEILDLYDKNTALGTEVKINLPILKFEEIL